MEQIKTVLVDCDGVLYDSQCLTYEQMVAGCQRAGEELGIHWNNVVAVHDQLKSKGIHGWYNTTLFLCRQYGVDFNDVARQMIPYIDYTHIPEDLELLDLLKQVSQKKVLSLLTNNTHPHVDQVFNQLFHQTLAQTGLQAITVEDSLRDGYFHVKKQPDAFGIWCKKFSSLPHETLLLDDTLSVIESAKTQGLQTIQTFGPQQLKEILKGLL